MRNQSASEIGRELGGKQMGSKVLVSCPAIGHVDKAPSCIISDGQDGQIMAHCFAGCDWRDIKAGLESMGMIQPFEPRSERSPEERRAFWERRQETRAETLAQQEQYERSKIAMARTLWNDASTGHEAVARYFAGRGITEFPDIFRYRPDAWNQALQLRMPAVIVPLTNVTTRKLQAVQIIYLDETGTRKANLKAPKITRGVMRGGAVQLAEPGEALAIAEGVETALSYMQLSGVPTWAVLGTSAHKKFKPPPGVRRIILAADNDAPGIAAARAASQNLMMQGFETSITLPKHAGADFNDAIKERAQ